MNQTKTYDELLIELLSYYSDLQKGKNPAMVRLEFLNLRPESSLMERCSFVAGMCLPVGTEKSSLDDEPLGFRQRCVSFGYNYAMVRAGYCHALSQSSNTLRK